MIYPPDKGGSGAPIYTNHLLRSLVKRGYETGIVFSTHFSYEDSHREGYKTYPLYFANPPIFDSQPSVFHSVPFKNMSLTQITEYIDKFYRAFTNLITEEKYDLLHVQHGMYIGYAACLAKEKLKVPFVITLHTMEINFLEEFPDPLMALKAMVEAERIIALTKAQKKRLLETYSYEEIIRLEMKHHQVDRLQAEKNYQEIVGLRTTEADKIIVCPLGIDMEMFKIIHPPNIPDDLSRLNIKDTEKIVMFAGRLIEMKGIRYLLEAEKLYNRQGNIHTIIIGGGNLEELVTKEASKRKNVHYLGFKKNEEVPFYHNYVAERKGIFCVPSRSEGMSLVYLEALACGTRVVGCCKKDMGDLEFMRKPNVYLTEFGNSEYLAETITEVFSQTPLPRQEIRRSVENYNLENMFNLVRRQYEAVLNQKTL